MHCLHTFIKFCIQFLHLHVVGRFIAIKTTTNLPAMKEKEKYTTKQRAFKLSDFQYLWYRFKYIPLFHDLLSFPAKYSPHALMVWSWWSETGTRRFLITVDLQNHCSQWLHVTLSVQGRSLKSGALSVKCGSLKAWSIEFGNICGRG